MRIGTRQLCRTERQPRESLSICRNKMAQYLENPILLVNSSGPRAASGRNVRAQFRTSQAAKGGRSASTNAHFGVFEVDIGLNVEPHEKGQPCRKRSKRDNHGRQCNTCIPAQLSRQNGKILSPIAEAVHPEPRPPTLSILNPTEVLAYATFHIRLLASMTVLTNLHRDHLSQVLLCRQWSCISISADRLGKSDVLDSCLECVAAKVYQLNGNASSSSEDLVLYEKALLKLQDAIRSPKQHEITDLRTSVQLLAMYEMLLSFNSPSWSQHISGVKLLSQPQSTIMAMSNGSNTVPCALTIPIAAEALLTGNDDIFEDRSWRTLLRTACEGPELSRHRCVGLVTCMVDLPLLISDAKAMLRSSYESKLDMKHSLLDRASTLRSRIRSDVLNEDAYVLDRGSKVGAFDSLGMCLAGLIALDRIIASLRADEELKQKSIEDRTEEFCAQMLHLDLGAGGAYAASDLMLAFHLSPFQQQAAYIIVLPGRSGSDG